MKGETIGSEKLEFDEFNIDPVIQIEETVPSKYPVYNNDKDIVRYVQAITNMTWAGNCNAI
jgi:hypothetical protein